MSASATDNQKVAKTSLTIDGKEVAIAYGSSISYSWNTRKVAKGAHAVTVRAWDAGGNTTSKSVTVYREALQKQDSAGSGRPSGRLFLSENFTVGGVRRDRLGSLV